MTTTSSQTDLRKPSVTISSRDNLRFASMVLATIGFLVTLYLVYIKVTNTQQICLEAGTFNCDLVQSSIYSKIGPLPIQFLGLAGYAGILAVLIFETRVPLLMSRGKIILFAVTLLGFLYSIYLTMIEAFVLNAWCMWCLISAITMTLLFGVSTARLWISITTDSEVPDED